MPDAAAESVAEVAAPSQPQSLQSLGWWIGSCHAARVPPACAASPANPSAGHARWRPVWHTWPASHAVVAIGECVRIAGSFPDCVRTSPVPRRQRRALQYGENYRQLEK